MKKITIESTLNTTYVNMLTRLWMCAYRKGVEDAAESCDEGLCLEHIALTRSKPMTFGFLERVRRDAFYWQLKLAEIYTSETWDKYRLAIGRYGSNYLSVALVLAQEFYNLGLTDFFDKTFSKIEDLRTSKSNWAMFTLTGVKDVGRGRIIEIAQGFCYDRMDLDESFNGDAYAISKRHYDMFIKRLWLTTRYGRHPFITQAAEDA